jgi:excinuclease UvrABC ATPase subunit
MRQQRNNLRDDIVEVSKRRLTMVTGVSGSRKGPLMFEAIAAECQRQINET